MLRRLAVSAARRLGSHHEACIGYAPSTSYSTHQGPAEVVDGRAKMVNKLLYRSKQRGFLELDLLIGLWAERETPKMSTDRLQEMSVLLDEENPDLFKWLTGQLPAPERMLSNGAFTALRAHVAQQLAETSPQPARAKSGQDWVRGWDDGWRSQAKDAAKGKEANA